MSVIIECCVNCICVPVCINKHENDLIHNCSIIRNELMGLAPTMESLGPNMNNHLAVSIDSLNKELILETNKSVNFLFVRCLINDPYSTLIPIRKAPVLCFADPEKEEEFKA